MTDEPNYIGDIILELRTRRGLSQVELARRAGLSITIMNAYEKKRTQPTVKNLLKICRALNYVIVFKPREKMPKKYYKEIGKK